MKSFNFKKLIGVFVVSATVLLTGCKKIEAISNFGKAVSVLDTQFDSVYDEQQKVCEIQYEIQRMEIEIKPNEVLLTDQDIPGDDFKDFRDFRAFKIQKAILRNDLLKEGFSELDINKNETIIWLTGKIDGLKDKLEKDPKIKAKIEEVGHNLKKKMIGKFSLENQLKKCGDLREAFQEVKNLSKTIGKFGELIYQYNELNFDKFEETKNALYNLPGEISVLINPDNENEKATFDTGKINSIIDKICAFAPEAIMRARVLKELKEFIISSKIDIEGGLTFLEKKGLLYADKKLEVVIEKTKHLGELLDRYSTADLNPGIILGRERVFNSLSYLEKRKDFLRKYKLTIQEVNKGFSAVAKEAKKREGSFEGEDFLVIMKKLVDLTSKIKN